MSFQRAIDNFRRSPELPDSAQDLKNRSEEPDELGPSLLFHDVLLLPNDLRFSHPLYSAWRERCSMRQRTVSFLSLPRKNVIPAASKPGKLEQESRLCLREMQVVSAKSGWIPARARLAGMTFDSVATVSAAQCTVRTFFCM